MSVLKKAGLGLAAVAAGLAFWLAMRPDIVSYGTYHVLRFLFSGSGFAFLLMLASVGIVARSLAVAKTVKASADGAVADLSPAEAIRPVEADSAVVIKPRKVRGRQRRQPKPHVWHMPESGVTV